MTIQWYVARTRRAWDKLAEKELQRQGFNPWLQTLKITTALRGAWVEAERPVFPFYQFIQFDLEGREGPRWQAAYSTPNVRCLLPKGATEPVPVPKDLVESLRGVGTLDEVARVVATYVEGETQFWIKIGPFADFIGTYKEAHKGALLLTTHIFGRETDVEVPRHWLEKI